MLPQELEDFFSISMKNLIGILVGFTLHLGSALGNMDIFTISVLLIHDICSFYWVFILLLWCSAVFIVLVFYLLD